MKPTKKTTPIRMNLIRPSPPSIDQIIGMKSAGIIDAAEARDLLARHHGQTDVWQEHKPPTAAED